MDTPEPQELVDAPRERLDVEFMAWLDLKERETTAKLAKHLCALANFCGGYWCSGPTTEVCTKFGDGAGKVAYQRRG